MNRNLGHYPVSVSTSVVLERILNPSGFDYGESVKDTKTFIVSVDTLYRNINSSLTSSDYTSSELADALLREIDFIKDEFSRRNKIKVVFYLSVNSDILHKFRDVGKIKEKRNTALHYEHVRDGVLSAILPDDDILYGEYYSIDFGINEYTETIIMTHQPCELLRFHELNNIRLIESHTAALKRRSSWYTKLNNGNKLIPMPFNELTLLVFGDGYLFGTNRKLSTVLKKCAVDLMWRSDTTYADVKSSILEHPLIKDGAVPTITKIITEY